MPRFTGPDGPYPVEFAWPDGICGEVVGRFRVVSMFGRDVPAPADLLCTKNAGHDPDEGHFCELNWQD